MKPSQGYVSFLLGVTVMFRARTLCSLGVAIVVAAGLAWSQSGPVGPPDDGKERPPAERIVGTWSMTGEDHFKNVWWHSVRLHLYADGKWMMSSNDDWRLFRNERNRGTYELVGGVLRRTGREFPDSPARQADGLGPNDPLRLTTWDAQIAVLTATNLTLRTEREGGDPPCHVHYRRIR